MLFSELLRITVLTVAGVATALGAVSVIAAQQEQPTTFALALLGGWWIVAALGGLAWGGSARASESIAPVLRTARTATSLPPDSEVRITLMRLWPVGAFALVCGIAGAFFPQVAAIGTGYAILIALAWRRREAAVQAIEDRDGVRFYVEPSSAFAPVRLVRTPGLYRGRSPRAKAPPPPPAPG